MKAIIRLISTALLLSFVTVIAAADSGRGWYISKRGVGVAPGFPDDSEFLSEHSCYFVDKRCETDGEKVIYLTFDAGYENGNIAKILDTLKEKDVSAAFFVLSNLILKETELVKRMINDGHTLCNHTRRHKTIPSLSESEARDEVCGLEKICFENTGYRMPKYFRYPEGYYSKESALLLEKMGYKSFFWSVAYADWDNAKQPSCERAMETLKKQTHPGAVVLLHPTSQTNARILGDMIDYWREIGYRFGTLDELTERN